MRFSPDDRGRVLDTIIEHGCVGVLAGERYARAADAVTEVGYDAMNLVSPSRRRAAQPGRCPSPCACASAGRFAGAAKPRMVYYFDSTEKPLRLEVLVGFFMGAGRGVGRPDGRSPLAGAL